MLFAYNISAIRSNIVFFNYIGRIHHHTYTNHNMYINIYTIYIYILMTVTEHSSSKYTL